MPIHMVLLRPRTPYLSHPALSKGGNDFVVRELGTRLNHPYIKLQAGVERNQSVTPVKPENRTCAISRADVMTDLFHISGLATIQTSGIATTLLGRYWRRFLLVER